jgi:hypothetical protein
MPSGFAPASSVVAFLERRSGNSGNCQNGCRVPPIAGAQLLLDHKPRASSIADCALALELARVLLLAVARSLNTDESVSRAATQPVTTMRIPPSSGLHVELLQICYTACRWYNLQTICKPVEIKQQILSTNQVDLDMAVRL